MKERTETVEAFQRGKLDLLCVTTGAGGVGPHPDRRPHRGVPAAALVPGRGLQAEDRCHRIGSEIHDSIEVIDVVATKTIDTRVRAVLHEKAGQLADLFRTGASSPSCSADQPSPGRSA
jgi:hypothetical protein